MVPGERAPLCSRAIAGVALAVALAATLDLARARDVQEPRLSRQHRDAAVGRARRRLRQGGPEGEVTKWQGKAPAKGGNKYYWNGNVPIDGVGSGQISLVGGQKALDSATVGWPKDIVLAKVLEMLTAQFPKGTKLEQVRGACPDERLSGSRIYRATLAGRKPLYLHVQYAAGDRGGSTSTIEMEPQRNKGWIC
jgi:hypothetical protein